MPLNELAYDTNYGEWLPYDGSNYSDRAKAMFFLNSFNATSTLVTGASVEFLSSLNLGNPDITLSSWPLTSEVQYNHTLPVYTVSHQKDPDSDDSSIIILVNKPAVLAFYELFPGNAQEMLDADTAVYDQYKAQLDSILVDGELNSSLLAFDWGNIEAGGVIHDESGAVSTIDPSRDIIVTESESGAGGNITTIGNYGITIPVITDPLFTSAASAPTFAWLAQSSTVEWGVEASENEFDGNFIKMAQSAAGGINPQSYISLGALGRYFVEDKITDDANSLVYLEVRRVDGADFPTGQTSVVDVVDITKVPRLRVKWRRRETTDPSVKTYTFTTREGEVLRVGASFKIEILMECIDDPIVVSDSVPNTGDAVFEMGGVFNINGLGGGVANLGKMPLGVQTTFEEGGEFIRVTPWRKGYRVMNRFRPKQIEILQTRGEEAAGGALNGTFKWNLTPKSASIPNGAGDNTYPLAIRHRPALIQIENGIGNSGRGTILFPNNYEIVETTGVVNSGGEPVWNADHVTTGDGFVLEQGTPNLIKFTVNLSDTGVLPENTNETPRPYDFTGRVSCSSTVVPAYSGEILAFGIDSSDNATHGFIESNYQLPSGNIATTAVFIDITETDEVLRWDGSGYDPAAKWADTISAITVRNDRTNIQITCDNANYEVISNEKDNYIVALFTDQALPIAEGDDIRILLRNKKVMENWQGNESPQGLDPTVDGAGYIPIAYRELNEEHLDDFRLPYIESSTTLPSFRIESDGEVDGNITIIPDGDVPEGTEFRLRIQDDDTTP